MSNDYNGKKRSELPDSVFGIPQERKYPMPDEKHTRSAIKLFNHVDPKYEEQLAKAIIKNMKKYGIDGSVVGPNNRLRKYLPKDMIKESATRPLIYTWERANIPEYSVIQESSHKSDFSYSGINTSTEKSEFKRNFREVFKEDPTESSINYMQMIKYKGDLVGYIGFSRYKEGKKKYLGIGNFMILKRYQRSGMGSKVISDIIDRYKDNYDEIYCYVDKDNTNAIAFYKKIAKVNTDNLTKYGYYVTLYSKSIGESAMLEGYLKSDKDIHYNKDKFDSGEINLCFITGLSGSGKSTMGRGMSSKDVEHYEMDDVICNDNFSDNNLKEYGGLIESFFKGSGKSFRLIRGDDNHNDSVFKSHKNYEKEITQAFVKHAISYCKSHKETKYVCDGIWIFMFIKPEQLKDCAVYIKGTSSIKSGYRALRRDIDEDKRNGMSSLQIFKHEFKRIKEDVLYARENQKELRSFRSYFEKQSTNESYIEESKLQKVMKDNIDESAPTQLENKDITIIFDLGDVLVKSNMMEDLKNKYKFSNSDIKTILSHWFDDSYDLYDSNTFIETMERVLPDKFKSRIFDIILAFKNISLYPYTEKILSDSKRLGYKIYYFSNWSRWGVELLEDANKLKFLHEYFNGGMFSYETKYKKPHKRFYDIFIQKFKLQKSNIIFFDNKQDNINMGKNFGWTGYVVDENLDQHFHDMISSYTNESSSILPQDTGISTVIFDMGDVLVSANIKDYLVADPEVPNEIVDELLKLWFIDKDEVDDTMDLNTYREIVNKRMGVEFSKYIPKLFQYNIDCVTAFDYTIPMIQDLKDKGYKVYYLSNWSAWTYDLLQEAGKFDFLKLMDGGVFSYDAGYMKPDEEIYKILLNKYKINPEEAVFFDDREENIEAANKLGIHGVHFPRHDSSIVYKNLFGYKLAKSIYEDINNIPYYFEPGRELEATYKLFLETNSMAITLQYEASKELMKIIKPVILEDKEFKNRAKELHLTLKCKLLPVKGSVISVLVLDGSQEYRDTPDARKLLNDIRASCIMIINKLSGLLKKYISKIDIGDGDEGCLYFHLNKLKAIVHDLKNKVVKEEKMDFPNIPIIFEDFSSDTPQINIQESIQEYGTTGGTIVGANQPLYFYHMVDSGANLSKGLLSLEYMYHHSKPLFLKNASKYRDRLCNGWDIYPGRDPKSLTAEEIYEGIKKFRNEDNLNTIYFFRYPPYSSLDKRFDRLYKYKKLYRININDPKVKSIIKNINYGWIDSNTGNDPLDRKYYETISPEDYFNNFDPDKGLLFSTLYHISIEVKNGYIPMKLLEEVKIPNTIEDIISIEESSIQEYGTTGGTIVGSNQPDSVYIVNYMQNNVFSGYKEPRRAICKKGMNQMYTTNSGKAIPVDIDKFKEEASDISIFRFKGTPVLSYDQIIENASTDNDFYLLLTGDSPEAYGDLEYDNRFVQEENFFDELRDITFCTESTITGQIESSHYPYMKILTESMNGRSWNFYRDINGVFAMNELTGLRTPSYENAEEIPKSQIKLIERGTVYFGN